MKLTSPNPAHSLLSVRLRSETAMNRPLGVRVEGLILTTPQRAPVEVLPMPAIVEETASEFGSATELNTLLLQYRAHYPGEFTTGDLQEFLAAKEYRSGGTLLINLNQKLRALELRGQVQRCGQRGKSHLWRFNH